MFSMAGGFNWYHYCNLVTCPLNNPMYSGKFYSDPCLLGVERVEETVGAGVGGGDGPHAAQQ